jgi:hypothetical protein
MQYGYSPKSSSDGYPARFSFPIWGLFVDFQRRHAAGIAITAENVVNLPGQKADDYSLTVLEAAGR